MRKFAPRLSLRAKAAAATSLAVVSMFASCGSPSLLALQRDDRAERLRQPVGVADDANLGRHGLAKRPLRLACRCAATLPRAIAWRFCGGSGGRAVAMSLATRAPNTTASSSEFEARRFAPCAPVEVTSPQAHKPIDGAASLRVDQDAAHVIMRRRRHGDGLVHRIDPGRLAGRNHRGEFLGNAGPEWTAIEKRTASANDFAMDGARHHIARAKLGVLMNRAHEAFAFAVDQ